MTPVEIRHFPAWRAVVGFPGYEVSDSGEVRSSLAAGFGRKPQTPRILRICADTHGYRRVYLRRDGRTHSLKVSWLVLAAFVGPRPMGNDACHNNGHRGDDSLANLRWDTRRGNLSDCIAHGTRPRGERIGNSKLTASGVQQIRAQLAAKVPQARIADASGVAQSTVSKIARGQRWAWLP